tara:strand:- start:39 stop:512 length:474 start_codon:yes stop_codon:yes gene_type:complete
MNSDHLNIYNNLIKLTRNKNLYYSLKNKDTFSDRLIVFMFHFSFFLKTYKKEMTSDYSQNFFDFVVRQIELSIREIGYGDVSVNKKMKEYVNLFYSILEKIENWDSLENTRKIALIADFININEDDDLIVNYFNKYNEILLNNSFKIFIKEIIEIKF